MSLLNTVSLVTQITVNLERVCIQGKRYRSVVIKAILYMEFNNNSNCQVLC